MGVGNQFPFTLALHICRDHPQLGLSGAEALCDGSTERQLRDRLGFAA